MLQEASSNVITESNMWLAKKDVDAEVNTAKKNLVAWAKTQGLSGTALEELDTYVLELCQAYAENQ